MPQLPQTASAPDARVGAAAASNRSVQRPPLRLGRPGPCTARRCANARRCARVLRRRASPGRRVRLLDRYGSCEIPWLQRAGKFPQPECGAALYRSQWNPEPGCDFRLRVVAPIGEFENVALFARQCGERSADRDALRNVDPERRRCNGGAAAPWRHGAWRRASARSLRCARRPSRTRAARRVRAGRRPLSTTRASSASCNALRRVAAVPSTCRAAACKAGACRRYASSSAPSARAAKAASSSRSSFTRFATTDRLGPHASAGERHALR